MAQDYTSFRPTTTHTRTTGKTIYTPAGSGESHGTVLQKGQLLRGQVTNITAHEITLLLENGQNLTARYDNALELLIGDSASFRVLSSDDQGIILRALLSNHQAQTLADATILKALESASLPVTERNISLVSSLLKNNMPIHTQMLNQMLQQAFQNPDISISNLVTMNHIGLPVTPETTQWFENYCNLEHQLLPQFQDVTAEALGYLSDLLGQSTAAAAKYAHTLLAIPKSNRVDLSAYVNPTAPDRTAGSLSGQESANAVALEQTLSRSASAEVFVDTDLPDTPAVENLTTTTPTLIESTDLQDFLQILREWQLPEGLTLADDPPDSRNLIRVLQAILSTDKMLPHTENGIRQILKHPFFEQLTSELFLTSWTLAPEELLQKDSIPQLYESILSQLNQLEEVMGSSAQTDRQSSAIQQAKQNLSFLNTLNNFYTYVQLPLQLTGGHTHADLYVYTNRRAKEQPDDRFSCLLHLNMSRLGSLDIRVQMEAGQVKTFFYLDDKDAASLIEAHLPELDEAVARHGIPMTTQVIRHPLRTEASGQTGTEKESSPFLQNLLGTNEPSSNVQRYSFDVRA